MVEILCACILVSFCPVCARPCASNPFQSHHVLLTPIERERERNGLCIPFKQSPMPSLWIQSKAEVKPKTKSSKDSGHKAGQGAQMGQLEVPFLARHASLYSCTRFSFPFIPIQVNTGAKKTSPAVGSFCAKEERLLG